MSALKSLKDLDVHHERVFVRVDFNVPIDKSLNITDDARIVATLPTLRYLMENGARLVIGSHLGRPQKGRQESGKSARDPKYSLEHVGLRLAELLKVDVILSPECIGPMPKKLIHDLREHQVVLLENLRYHPEEETDDANFARELAALADVYVNDAFGVSHRAHASVHALPRIMPKRAAGILMQNEVDSLARLTGHVEHPFVAVLGGAKVSDKVTVIEALFERIDALLIGGAMANTFLAAQGYAMGASLVEEDKTALARTLIESARKRNIQLMLPEDVVVGNDVSSTESRTLAVQELGVRLGKNDMVLDIGPKTVEKYRAVLRSAHNVFWNGPMGFFENPVFRAGSLGMAEAMSACLGFTVVGGGDSVAVVELSGLRDKFGHISTGGGASLEFIEGRKLPGIEVLTA